MQLEPLSGHVFLFSNAPRDRLKLLWWGGSGLWVCTKWLEVGRFGWPQAEGGINLAGSKRRAWLRKLVSTDT